MATIENSTPTLGELQRRRRQRRLKFCKAFWIILGFLVILLISGQALAAHLLGRFQ